MVVSVTKPVEKPLPVTPTLKRSRREAVRQQYDPRYWVIRGKSYDLSEFIDKHPGGSYILLLGKGRDCTELFESVHALSGINGPRSMLRKYEVKDAPIKEELFAWEDDGFYGVLRKRVSDRFKGRNYKATWFVLFKILILISLYVFCWTQAFITGNYLYAIASGIFTEMVGFCLMHDSSHNAVSKRPSVNYCGLLWSSWTLWNHWTWLQHHVYGHHSYTGVYGKDPDVHNVEILIRKHLKSKKMNVTKFQHWYTWVLLTVLPNQHLGQALLYQIHPHLSKTVFVTPYMRSTMRIQLHSIVVMALSIVWHVFIPLMFQSFGTVALLWLLNYTFMGISYFVNVAPNHDTETTLRNHPAHNEVLDWGEHQVRCTGNHSISTGIIDRIITHLWGGMNYQIEHHLFPALNHAHYPEVSKIVQETCKEFNIPYNAEPSWLASLKSYGTFIAVMAKFPRGGEYSDYTKST
uniref:Cytochrome b5 heme-binding domain-containing protein n=1 Tax=Vannella robusta TaxID=1487602 RepID=A0A7S4IGU0_9EUKA